MWHRHPIHAGLAASVLAVLVVAVGPPPVGAVPPTILHMAGPAGSGAFGEVVVTLANGNVVVGDSTFDLGAVQDVGAVYLYDGASRTLISTLTGSTAGDRIGYPDNIVALANGDFVVGSPLWDNGAIADVGAATQVDGTTGLDGVVSAANSLHGTTPGDRVGFDVTPLTNGNYVVTSSDWDGPVVDGGVATWVDGTTGLIGPVTTANSLYGTTTEDYVGDSVEALTNGNYVVTSYYWDNGAVVDAGASTWGNGATGTTGPVSPANSLVGSAADDWYYARVYALPNGNYIVSTPRLDVGAAVNAGAATWANGTTGVSGPVSSAISLVGSTTGDNVGYFGVVALTNGNYVIVSPDWDNGGAVDAGAATWANGTTGITGPVTTVNSLYGPTANDRVGLEPVAPLTNGNYVVASPTWDNGAAIDAGAATWGNGTTGITGPVTTANSLHGTTAHDYVGAGLIALSNGNYVVGASHWDNGAAVNVGAVTWANGTTGITGPVTTTNSLYGASAQDYVGDEGGDQRLTALTNGNYVVGSPRWDNGGAVNAGAVTWGNGTTGTTGPVTTANSLYGTTASDGIGVAGIVALANGNYVAASMYWDNAAVVDVGAITWGNGTTGTTGPVSAANSTIGSTADDRVGEYDANWMGGLHRLGDGNFVVVSSYFDAAAVDGGAATWVDGTAGFAGTLPAATSVVGLVTGSMNRVVVVFEPVNGSVLIGRSADNIVSWMLFPPEGPLPSVSVTKRVDGATPWSFDISISPVPTGQPATRTVTNIAATVSWTSLIAGVTYTVSETPKTNWEMGDLVCIGATGDTNTTDATFTPAAGDQVTCTVENSEALPNTGTETDGVLTAGLALIVFGGLLIGARRRRLPRW